MKLSAITILKEGGNATAQWGSTRVNKADIPSTIKHVSELCGIPVRDLHAIGSVGKVPTSGDIDLAVDQEKYDPEFMHDRMMKAVNDEGVYNKGTKVASYAVPIKGDEANGKVQVDFMYTDNIDWAKFAYHSEGEGSRYKGAIRNILLSSVAAAMNEPGTDHFEFDGEDLIIRAGRTVDLASGLRRIFQHRPMNKKGDARLKGMKPIPIEEFKKLYPKVKIKGGTVIVNDPQKVINALFGGETIKPSDLNTAEQTLHLIKRKFSEAQAAKIFKIAKMRAKPVVGKMRLPPELMDYEK